MLRISSLEAWIDLGGYDGVYLLHFQVANALGNHWGTSGLTNIVIICKVKVYGQFLFVKDCLRSIWN